MNANAGYGERDCRFVLIEAREGQFCAASAKGCQPRVARVDHLDRGREPLPLDG